MYDDIAEKLFVLVIQKRQYNFYLNNLKLYSIPSASPLFTFPQQNVSGSLTNRTTTFVKEDLSMSLNAPSPSKIPESEKVYDIRYYNELMDSVPAEYVSTPLILHCMLEQVTTKISYLDRFILKIVFQTKVVATEEKKGLPSETHVDTTIPQIANFSIEICKHLSDMVNNLGLDEKEIKV